MCCLIQPSSSKVLSRVPGTTTGCVNDRPHAEGEAQYACQRKQHVVISAGYGLHSTGDLATCWKAQGQGVILDTGIKVTRFAS